MRRRKSPRPDLGGLHRLELFPSHRNRHRRAHPHRGQFLPADDPGLSAGRGAYIVTKDNLGRLPSLIAAAALLIDYVLTVAVSVAAGIAAVTSAVPRLYPYRIALCVLAVAAICVANPAASVSPASSSQRRPISS